MASRESADTSDEKGLYKTLGVLPNADATDLRKAYRRLALQWHPDKNPDDPSATARFQEISTAYEVLSDPERRQMYDETGCVNAEELEGQADATDLFSYVFRSFDEDLDADEQILLDELLRIAGGSVFKKRGRKGRRGKKGGPAGGNAEAQFLQNMFMAAVSESMPQKISCPQGHPLKRRKAPNEYECDVCNKDISTGKRFFDCRKCDYSVCQKCEKTASAEEPLEVDVEELVDVFCDMHTTPVRAAQRMQVRCNICGELLSGDVPIHMTEKHEAMVESFLTSAVEELEGGVVPDEMGMFSMMDMGGLLGALECSSSKPSGRRQRKRR